MTLDYWTLYEAPPDSPKKWVVRVPTASGKGKTVLFGARGYEDFTTHHDVERRERYRTRHQHDRLDDPYAPGFWSMWALWGDSDDLDTAFADAVKRAKKILKQTGADTPRHNPDITAAQQRRIEQHLEKQVRVGAKVCTVREWLENLRAAGATLTIEQVSKVKDMSRRDFNRATGKEQQAHARRQREAGMKTQYWIERPDGVAHVVGKIEADYFQSLPSPFEEQQESQSGLPVASDEELDHLFGRKNPVREQFDFTRYEEYAAGLSDADLYYAIFDAMNALKAARTWDDDGAGEGKYFDQLSVLRTEQQRRR
jgi:hypothetical protein